jgi:hypothetical protein
VLLPPDATPVRPKKAGRMGVSPKDLRQRTTSNLDTKVSHFLEAIIPLDGCLSFVALRFQSVRCGKFPIPMWLKAESTRMKFTRFPGRCTTGGTTHGVHLLHGEFLGFHSAFVFLVRRCLRQEENIPFCSGHLPAENLLKSALDFFGVKQFLT